MIWVARLDRIAAFWGFGGIPSAGREVITYNDGDMSDELGLGAAAVEEEARDTGRDLAFPSSAGGVFRAGAVMAGRAAVAASGCSGSVLRDT